MTTELPEKWESVEDGRFRRLAVHSGIPIATYESHRLYNFLPIKGAKVAYQAVLDYIAVDENWEPKREHHFITLGGDPGVGKTHLALGIGWHWLVNDMGMVKYWQVEQLLDAMRREYDVKPADRYGLELPNQLEWATKTDLLILDDLGAEKGTEWANAKLDELIDHRYINLMPTVITTNLVFSQMPGRIASRLQEGITVLLDAPDYRKYKAQMRQRKHSEGNAEVVTKGAEKLGEIYQQK